MRALRSFTVRPVLPPPLAPLMRLAMNLRWSWDERVRDLFRWVDPDGWERSGHDPVRLLGSVGPERLEALAHDPAFCGLLDALRTDLEHYLATPGWFAAWQARTGSPLRAVAYFSPEFGIAEAIPQYSGGLGVLAGDHLKAASALGVPLVGVGLFYRQGYFHQVLDAEGWQRERYADLDPYAMALTPAAGGRVTVDLAGTPLAAQVWRAEVGRVRLFLLDSDVEENDAELRRVTDRLYGGDVEHRLRQEILLGIGGVRALDAVGEPTQVFHTNEGHAGFLALECLRRAMVVDGLSFEEAVEAVRAATIFTTHTPVPAGIDRFPRPLMEKYFTGWCEEVGIPFERLMALGHAPGEPEDAPFNMAVLGLRLAGRANGVSRLHGSVSRLMFSGLWPGVPVEEVPISAITNGVHPPTWVAPEMTDLLDRYVLPEWQEAGPDRWARIADAPDEDIWRVREQCRQRLVAYVRARLRAAEVARGGAEAAWVDAVFDPRALTIGFARRFASYKRATLLLSDPDRLRRLLLDPDRPVQLVFAGKAHPADEAGKEMIRQIVQFARRPDVRHRVVFLEDYDIATARALYQGCDLWLNHPRRPLEACGTSGQKAALNGALNCSVLDGWWDEMYDGENGWAIPSAEHHDDLDRRDEVEATSLFELLEREVVPLFFERDETGVPRRWVQRIRHSLATLGPKVSASRMLQEYVERLYGPTAERAEAFAAAGRGRARALAAWKARVREGWPEVQIRSVDAGGDAGVTDLGATRSVTAVVSLGSLGPDDVTVELLHGPVGPNDELQAPSAAPMRFVALAEEPGSYRYAGEFRAERAGRYGFAVRVVPSHPDLVTFAELGCPPVT